MGNLKGSRDVQTVTPSGEATEALARRVEALLFVAPGPVTVGSLARTLRVTPKELEAALSLLAESRKEAGVVVQRHGDEVQLVTAADLAPDVERFLQLEPTARLSQAAVETLAIIAYMQPVTRAEIEAIRGVNSDSVLRSLLSKGLIQEVGRLETVGRPILYGTTPFFLQYFGLNDLSELPALAEKVLAEKSLDQALQRWREEPDMDERSVEG